MSPIAKRAVNAVENKRLIERFNDLLGAAEVGVVTRALAGQKGVDGVMKIVGPLSVQAVAAGARRIDQADVVEIAFGDDVHGTSESRGFGLGHLLDLAQDVPRPKIVDRVHCVDPQPVDMEVANPHPHVVEHIGPHGVAAGVVIIDGPTPRRVIPIGEVGTEVADVSPLGTEVVVDDVDKDGQTDAVAGGH